MYTHEVSSRIINVSGSLFKNHFFAFLNPFTGLYTIRSIDFQFLTAELEKRLNLLLNFQYKLQNISFIKSQFYAQRREWKKNANQI